MRHSVQRQLVLEVLSSTKTHPDAMWIYSEVRKTLPKISLGTVYRNLNELVSAGLAKRVLSASGAERFDADTTSHAHFICKTCGNIFDAEMPKFPPNNYVDDEDFKVDDFDVVFYGLCKNCS